MLAHSLMDLPPPRQSDDVWTATSFYTNRSDEDQYQVKQMANVYFETRTLSYLRATLGKETLAFDNQELTALQRAVAALKKNESLQRTINIEKTTPNIDDVADVDGVIQFYDFCLTIDSLKNILRLFHSHLTNVPNLPDESFKQIENEVFYPDFVPAFVREKTQDYPQDEQYIAGYSLNGPNKTLPKGDGFELQPKQHIDKAVCEAVLLSSGIFNTHQALTQGLFVVHGTIAQKLRLTDDFRDLNDPNKILSEETIDRGKWINTFEGTGMTFYDEFVDATEFYKLGPTRDEFEVNPQARYKYNIQILQPKYTDYLAYSRYLTNPRLPAAASIDVVDRQNVFKSLGNVAQPMQSQGGAIGVHIDTWFIIPKDRLPTFSFVDGDEYVRGLHVTEHDIMLAMSRLPFHPISSCPKLSKAYKESGTANQVLQMIETLQQVLLAQAKKRASTSATKAFSIDTLNEQKAASGGYIPHCGPGFTAQFYKKGENGKYVSVPEDEALVSRDGNLELASHIARDHIQCVPRVTVAQLGGKFSIDNLAYHPVVVRETRDPADVRAKAPPSSYPARFESNLDITAEFGDFAQFLTN